MPEHLVRSTEGTWRLSLDVDGDTTTIEGDYPAVITDVSEILERVGYTSYIPAQRSATNFRSAGPSANIDLDSQLDQELDFLLQARPSLTETQSSDRLIEMLRDYRTKEDTDLRRRRSLPLTGATFLTDRSFYQRLIDLDYASYREDKPAIKELFQKIATIATEIANGFPIEAIHIDKDRRGLYPSVTTAFGSFPMNHLSQGTLSLIHCISHVLLGYAEYYDFPNDLHTRPGIVIIDEIDAHLHPTWQRRIIPTLIRHFPEIQIFCSTHSPMMLAGLKAGQVQLLRRESDGSVRASTNQFDIVGWTSDEILRHLFELSSPTDVHTDENIRRLQKLRKIRSPSPSEQAEIDRLRYTVSSELLSHPLATEVTRLADKIARVSVSTEEHMSGRKASQSSSLSDE